MATVNLDLVPFSIPDGVHIKRLPGRRQDGFFAAKPMQLSELPLETLEQMCADFRKSVLEAAGYTTQPIRYDDRDDVMPGSQEALNRR